MTRTHITKSCDDCGLETLPDKESNYWLQVHGTGRNEFRDRNSRPLDFCCAACMINYYERNELVSTPAFTALDKLITMLEQLSVPSILAHPDVVSAKEVITKAGKRCNINRNTGVGGVSPDLSKQLREYLVALERIKSIPQMPAPATSPVWPNTTTTTPYYPDTYCDAATQLNSFLDMVNSKPR